MNPKPKEWTEAEKQARVRLVRDGAGTAEIKAKLGRHAGSVKHMARELIWCSRIEAAASMQSAGARIT